MQEFLEKIREKKQILIKDIIYYIVYNLRKSGRRCDLEDELCDWDEAEEDILNSFIEFILKGFFNYEQSVRKLTESDKYLFCCISRFYDEMQNGCQNFYSISFTFFHDLAKTDEINEQKLLLTIKELDESKDLKKSILELFEKDGIYFICAIPFLQNLEHKAFCIFSLNSIFDYKLVYKGEMDQKDLETLLNRGFKMTDFEIEEIYYKGFADMEDLIEKFGIDPNYQDKNGNTILMNYFIKNTCEYKYSRYILISLLKLNFDLYLTNNEGYNTLDIACQYCHDNETLNLVRSAYGTFIDETKEEFEKEIKLAREKIKTICMP